MIETYNIGLHGGSFLFLAVKDSSRADAMMLRLRSIGAEPFGPLCMRLSSDVDLDTVRTAIEWLAQDECVHLISAQNNKIWFRCFPETNTKDVRITVAPRPAE